MFRQLSSCIECGLVTLVAVLSITYFGYSSEEPRHTHIFLWVYMNVLMLSRSKIMLQHVLKVTIPLFWTLVEVAFSRSERLIASASADKKVRLWSLDDLSCVRVRFFPSSCCTVIAKMIIGRHLWGWEMQILHCMWSHITRNAFV